MEGVNSCNPTDCLISESGDVTCIIPCSHSAYCDESDYTNWPFDIQKCHYNYVPRSRHINQLTLVNHSVEIYNEDELISSDWHLKSISGASEMFLDEFNEWHPSMIINFEIERHTQGYINQTMIPAVILMVINIFLLMLNPEFPERVILYVINLFSHFIYVEQLKWM